MDLLVTERGLEQLKGSSEAISFVRGHDWFGSILIPDLDGSLAAINEALIRESVVPVEVSINIEGADIDYNSNGDYKLKFTKAHSQDAFAKAASILSDVGVQEASKGSKSSINKSVAVIETAQLEDSGKITLMVDRRALQSLARNKSVLAIKPVGYKNINKILVDPYAVEYANKHGYAEVIIQTRLPLFSGHTSFATRAIQNKTTQRILEELLSGVVSKRPIKYMPAIGAAIAFLTPSDIEKLSRSEDMRIHSIGANRGDYHLSLATSTDNLLHLPGYWGSGILGSGQTIYVVDSGVEKNHNMLKQANGASEVVFEGCFQTDSATHKSVCPAKDSAGDSLPGLVNSGLPYSAAVCDPTFNNPPHPDKIDFQNRFCSHGTHVAGIAAGRYGATDVPLQGVAPEALIGSISITSRKIVPEFMTPDAVLIFEADWIQVLYQLSLAASGNMPVVINMSLGGGATPFPATTYSYNGLAMEAAVSNLKQAGIPVVAAMGNNSESAKIDVPAAINGVIKVGSVYNDGVGNTVHPNSNRAQTNAFPNEYIFFAPGAPVRSAYAYSTTTTGPNSGSSMATPHVSGLYALIKSWQPSATVDQVSDFIVQNLTHDITARACLREENRDCDLAHPYKSLGKH